MTSAESTAESGRINDYLRGRLDAEDAQKFEIQMLEDESLFARVQHEELFRQGLSEQPKLNSETSERSVRRDNFGKSSPLMRWLQPVLTGGFALATIALFTINLDLQKQLNQSQEPQAGIPVITMHDQRAILPGIQSQNNDLRGLSGPALLEIDVSAYEDQDFQVEIQTSYDIYVYERVQPDARGYLTVLLPHSGVVLAVKDMGGEKIFERRLN